MASRRDATGDLHVDNTTVDDSIAADHLGENHPQRPRAHRPGNSQLRQRPAETGQVRLLVDQTAPLNGDDLVDAVGKLVAPVLDVDDGVGMEPVASVDVSDSAHIGPIS